jgi:hypothetical protein
MPGGNDDGGDPVTALRAGMPRHGGQLALRASSCRCRGVFTLPRSQRLGGQPRRGQERRKLLRLNRKLDMRFVNVPLPHQRNRDYARTRNLLAARPVDGDQKTVIATLMAVLDVYA